VVKLGFLLVLIQLPGIGSPPDMPHFPEFKELEAMLPEAPELQAAAIEIRKARLQGSWTDSVNLHAGYSQHFASYTPVFSEPERTVSGDTFVLGISISVSLNRLLHGRKSRALELSLKLLEYDRLYEQKLASLRVLYRSRSKLVGQLAVIQAETKTAKLQLEKVRTGLEIAELAFDPIDLSQAEEKLARLHQDLAETELEIASVETRMFELLGKGRARP